MIGSAFFLSLLFAAAITVSGLFTVTPLLRLYGAGRENLAYAREYISVILSGSCFAGAIVGAFEGIGDPALAAMAVPGLRLFNLTLPLAGFQMISANYFQYVGKVKQSVILSSLRQLILLIPFALLFPAVTGMTGIWLATPAADLITFAVTIVFIKKELDLLKKQ